MADGRICDGIGFAQIKPDLRCASMPDRMDHSSTERRVGERLSTRASRSWPPGSRGYGPTDERPTTVYLCIGALGANVRFCRRQGRPQCSASKRMSVQMHGAGVVFLRGSQDGPGCGGGWVSSRGGQAVLSWRGDGACASGLAVRRSWTGRPAAGRT
jgi:hypothetical protein